MVFIDEIDAVGLRRQALGAGVPGMSGLEPVARGSRRRRCTAPGAP